MANSAVQKNAYLSIVMFDIDSFKGINDKYGHLVGDKTLIDLTDIVRRNISKSDIFSRWGGEEFILIFPDIHMQQTIEIAERLRKFISDHSFEEIGHVTCSFGVAAFEKDDDLDKVLHRADERLYMETYLFIFH